MDLEGALINVSLQKLCDAAREHGGDTMWNYPKLTLKLRFNEVGVDHHQSTDSVLCKLQNLTSNEVSVSDT